MRRFVAPLAFAFSLVASIAGAQVVPYPQTLPPNTVVGRMGVSPGPSQAIPFSVFSASIQATVQANLLGLTTKGDTNYTILTTDHYVVTSAAFTAARTWTLPLAGSVNAGQELCTLDQFGGVSATNTLTVARAGSDLINGATSFVLSNRFTGICFVADGASKWTTKSVMVQGAAAADKTYYVSTAGNDANTGLDPQFPKLTIQAAIDAAATAGVVRVGAGVYFQTSTLQMRPGVRVLCADGANITQLNGQNLSTLVSFITNAANGAALENCTVDGNRANNTDNSNNTLVNISDFADITLLNNKILNSTGYGIAAHGVRNTIIGNTISNVYQSGIFYSGSTQGQVTYARIERNRLSALGIGAIQIGNLSFYTVVGNYIQGSIIGQAGNRLHVTTSGTTVTWVSGPTFTSVQPGQALIINNGQEFIVTSVTDSTHLQVNTTLPTLTNVFAAIGSGDSIAIIGSGFGLVANNNVNNGVTFGIAVSVGGSSSSSERNLITGNTVTYSGKVCINLGYDSGAGAVRDNSVVGNELLNCGQSGGNSTDDQTGIFVGGGANTVNTFVNGNAVHSDSGDGQTIQWLATDGTVPAGSVVVGSNYGRGMVNPGVLRGISSITLSAGWGNTAATSAITSYGNAALFTVTANGTGIAANPTITVNTLVTKVPQGTVPYQCKMVGGTGTLTTISGEQNSTTAQIGALTFNGTPVAASTYQIMCQ